MSRLLFLLVIVLAILPSVILADGLMMLDKQTWDELREKGEINEPEQKAVIYFENGVEQLTISPRFDGPADKFAWVIPVPSKPEIELSNDHIYLELIQFCSYSCADDTVTIIDRKPIGDYDVSILSATGGGSLMKWLSENNYHLPQKAEIPIEGYIKKGWMFVACRVNNPDAAEGLRSGTLQPLKLTFNTKTPVYPLRLSMANPKPFALEVILILPSPGPDRLRRIEFERPVKLETNLYEWPWLFAGHDSRYYDRDDAKWRAYQYPTLAGLGRGKTLHIYAFGSDNVSPSQCSSDLVWRITGSYEMAK